MPFSKGNARFAARKKDHHGSGGSAYIIDRRTLGECIQAPCGQNAAVYLHIPFCSKLCSFCNMRRGLGFPDEAYVALMLRHIRSIRELAGRRLPVSSIYFGGGTPTTLSADAICRILDALSEAFLLSDDAEISMETSLRELTVPTLKRAMAHGLNRISVGVQTFDDAGRKLLGRYGDGHFARKRLAEYRAAGLKNVNIDLIYGYPGETVEAFRRDLADFDALDLAGFSYYALIVMPGSPMERIVARHALPEAERNRLDGLFFSEALRARDRFGYEQMELTKIVRPNRDAYRYIRNRIAGEWTIPIGAGAGGNVGGGALMNPIDLGAYARSLDALGAMSMPVFSPLYRERKRAISTIQLGYLERRHLEEGAILRSIAPEVEALHREGYFAKDKTRYLLTDLGLYWGNSIQEDLFSKLPPPDAPEKSI